MMFTSDTVRGFHWGPGGSENYDIGHWINEMKQMGMGWGTFVTDGTSLRNTMKACVDNSIVPIARMYRHGPTDTRMTQKDIDAVKTLRNECGVGRYITRNEGNLKDEWSGAFPQPIEVAAVKSAQNWLWESEQVFAMGGLPAIEPVAQCAFDPTHSSIRYYRAFFNWLRDNAFSEMKEMLKKGLWQSTHCATLNHYWIDAQGKWHFEHPKNLGMSTIDDDCSLIGHELPLDMIFNRWGVRPPVISTEGGVFRIFRQWDNRYPMWIQNDQDLAEVTYQMFRWLEDYVLGLNGQVPHPEYLGMCPWILGQDIFGHSGIWEDETWYPNRQDPRPVVRKLKENPPRKVRGVPIPVPSPTPEPTPVTLKGYLPDGTPIDPTELLARYNMKITPCSGPGYKVVEIHERCEAANCDVWVKGVGWEALPSIPVRWGWPGTEVTQNTDPLGRVGFAMANTAKYDPALGGGPHWTAVQGNSDRVDGIGMIMGTVHCTLNWVFQYVEAPVVLPPVVPPVVPPPVIDDPALVEFPRPPKDNGVGFHFGEVKTHDILIENLEKTKGLGATWCTYQYTTEDHLRRDIRAIYDSGVMPIIRPVFSPIRGNYAWARDVEICNEMGVPCYIQIFNEPSDMREWKDAADKKAHYPHDFARWWVEAAGQVVAAGGYPGLQALQFKELEAIFAVLPRDSAIWKRVWFSAHNYGLNHPPETEGDQWYALGFKPFVKMFIDYLGFVPPVICGECGWFVGDAQDNRYPPVSRALHAQYHKEMFGWFKSGMLSNGEPLPEYLFACNVWIIQGPEFEAWYGPDVKVESIQALHSIVPFERYKGAVAPPIVVPPEEEPMPELPFNFLNAIRLDGTIIHDRRAEFVQLVRDAGLTIVSRSDVDPLGTILGIVVHDSGELKDGSLPKPLGIIKDHIVRGLGGAYSIMIEKNGEATFSWPLKYVGNHCGRSVTNYSSIGICFILNGLKEPPTPAQLKTFFVIKDALHQLLGGGWGKHRDLFMTPHRWVVATQCPGQFVEHAILFR